MAEVEINELKEIKQFLYRLTKAMAEMNKKIDALSQPAEEVLLSDILNDKNKHDIPYPPSRDEREYEWEQWPEDWREDR